MKKLLYYNYQKLGYYVNTYPSKKIRGKSLKKEPDGYRLKQKIITTKH